jgi:hypothetical protein
MTGYGYAGAVNLAWQSAELDIEVAPAGPDSSFMRADGLVTWLDPVPVRDTAVGRRLRVLVSQGCPASDGNVVGVTNPGAHLGIALVPPGLPSSGLRCRYDGMNGHPFQLAQQQLLSAAQARAIALSMARTPLSHTIGGTVICPMDDASAELIVLAYPGRPDVDLWAYLSGCGGVSNGFISAGGIG